MSASTASIECTISEGFDGAEDGHTMIDVIKDKYLDDKDLRGNTSFIKIYIPSSHGNSGQDVPCILTLDNQNIRQAGEANDIQELCSHVTELDLTLNSLEDWNQIFTILDHLPKLHFLNLTSNPLAELSSNMAVRSYEQMRSLVLNKTRSSWVTVQYLLQCMPCLNELHLSLNEYTNVDLHKVHNSLHTLHINANKITDWRDVVTLGKTFPSLQTLVITETDLKTIDSTAKEMEQVFPALKDLNVNKTSINDWEELGKLNFIPNLQHVRLLGIPLLNDLEETLRRQLVIATLKKITKLNGSSVTELEREDAERAYIRYYMSKQEQPKRYFELEAKHGKLDPLACVSLQARTDVLILVQFEDKAQNMKIDVKQTVAQLKKKLGEYAGEPPRNIKLYYRDMCGSIGERELKIPSKKLFSLNIKDGDEIHVVTKSNVMKSD